MFKKCYLLSTMFGMTKVQYDKSNTKIVIIDNSLELTL